MYRKHILLMREFSSVLGEAQKLREDIDTSYERAYLALQKANVKVEKIEEIAQRMPLDHQVDIKIRSLMGIEIPKVTTETKTQIFPYGLTHSNSRLDEAYLEMMKVKAYTIKLAEIDVGMFRLAKAIQTSRKRVNGFKNIVIPKLETTIKIISDDLEKKERESFIRMKPGKKIK